MVFPLLFPTLSSKRTYERIAPSTDSTSPGDIRCHLTGEKQKRIRNILRLSNPPERNPVYKRLDHFFGKSCHHVCSGNSRRHCIDTDVVGSKFSGKRPGKSVYRIFTGRISHTARLAAEAYHGTGIQDTAATLLLMISTTGRIQFIIPFTFNPSLWQNALLCIFR